MAKRLDEFDWSAGPRRRASKYPWDKWCDGSIWQVRKGVDFYVESESFYQSLYLRAKSLNLKVRASKSGDVITFQFYKPEQSEAEGE